MKLMHHSLCVLAASAVAFVASCGVELDPTSNTLNYDPGAYPPGNGFAGVEQEAYRTGYKNGRRDAREGLKRRYNRHGDKYTILTEAQFKEGYIRGYENYSLYNPHVDPDSLSALSDGGGPANYRASKGQGQIQIMDGNRVVSTIRTASPNIESYHFKNGKTQIVVKSRGNHGPATVELFDTKTGALQDKVLAYAIKNGEPAWARGMQD